MYVLWVTFECCVRNLSLLDIYIFMMFAHKNELVSCCVRNAKCSACCHVVWRHCYAGAYNNCCVNIAVIMDVVGVRRWHSVRPQVISHVHPKFVWSTYGEPNICMYAIVEPYTCTCTFMNIFTVLLCIQYSIESCDWYKPHPTPSSMVDWLINAVTSAVMGVNRPAKISLHAFFESERK